MMKKLKNRILCCILAIVSVIYLMPSISAMASEYYDGGWNMTKVSTNVVDEHGTKIGSLSAYEGVTVLDYHPSMSGMVKVEYSAASSAKRGYIPNSSLYLYEGSKVGRITSTSTTYYTPSNTFYAGSVSTGEFVAVLAVKNGWAYVEYNVSNGLRKRAYMPQGNISIYTNSNLISSSFYQDSFGRNISTSTTSYTTVYSGPSEHYATIGTIYPEDNGKVKSYSTWNTSGTWHYVSYPAGGTVKYGYIKQ